MVIATGYVYTMSAFLRGIRDRIQWTPDGQYAVNADYSIDAAHSIFVKNADLHTHGFNNADLGLGPYRNAVILNTILNQQYFSIERGSAFQSFH